MGCISSTRKKIKLKGNVEADETYESINLKGTKSKDMPRCSKSRSFKGGSKRETNNHQVFIASVIDEYDNCFLEIVSTGPITPNEVKRTLNDKLDTVKYLITDCKSFYESLVKEKKIKLEQVKSGAYVNSNGFNLANINSFHSKWSTFLSHFKGAST